jgi:hypothetical protein
MWLNGRMSTVDPALARRARAERVPSNVRVVVVLVVLVVGGFLSGYGWGSFGRFGDDELPDRFAIVAIPVGMLATILGSIVWMSLVMRRADIGVGFGQAAVLVSAAIGLLLAARIAGDSVPLVIIGAVILVLGIAAGVLGAVAGRRRIAEAQRAVEAMRSGTQTEAIVTDQGWTIFSESPRILTTVTFSFVDLQGVQRWVQRPMVIHAVDPLVNGARTRLWYDPSDPGDDRRIAVEAALASPIRPAPRGAGTES